MQSSQQPNGVLTISVPIVQMRKSRHRISKLSKVKQRAGFEPKTPSSRAYAYHYIIIQGSHSP